MISKIIVIGHGEDLQKVKSEIKKHGIDALIVNADDHHLDAIPYLVAPHKETLYEQGRKFCQPHPRHLIESKAVPGIFYDTRTGWPTNLVVHSPIITDQDFSIKKFQASIDKHLKKRKRATARKKRI